MRRIATLLALSLLIAPAAWADTVVLDNGDVINGKIIETNEDATILESPVFGTVTLPHGRIVSVTADAEDDPAQVEKAQTAEQTAENAKADGTADSSAIVTVEPPDIKKVRPGLFGTNFMRGWEKSIGAGINGSTGNTDAVSFNASFNLFFEDDDDRWDMGAAYFYAKTTGGKTQDQAFAFIRKDWLFDSPWFIFAEGRADYDAFKDYDYRLSAAVGPGYDFIKTETFRLSGRVGLGVSKEFGGSNNNVVLEALLGLEETWQITENQSLNSGITVYPALTDIGEFRAIAYVDYAILLDKGSGLSLKFGLLDEYISNSGTAEKNDLLYYGQLVLEF